MRLGLAEYWGEKKNFWELLDKKRLFIVSYFLSL